MVYALLALVILSPVRSVYAALRCQWLMAERWAGPLAKDFSDKQLDPKKVKAFRRLFEASAPEPYLPPVVLKQREAWVALIQASERGPIDIPPPLTRTQKRKVLQILDLNLSGKPILRADADHFIRELWGVMHGVRTTSKTAAEMLDRHFDEMALIANFEDVMRRVGFIREPKGIEKLRQFRMDHAAVEERLMSVASLYLWNSMTGHPVPPSVPSARLASLTPKTIRALIAQHGVEGARAKLHQDYGVLAQDTFAWQHFRRWHGRLFRVYLVAAVYFYPPVHHAIEGLTLTEADKKAFEQNTFVREQAIELQLKSWIEAETALDDQPPSPEAVESKRKDLEAKSDDELKAYLGK